MENISIALIGLLLWGVSINSLLLPDEQNIKNILENDENITENSLAVEYAGEKCLRNCSDSKQRICYYKFVLEYYNAMGGACGDCAKGVAKDCDHPQCITVDGREKGVMSINRKIPGPIIQICKNDLVVVDVVNMAAGTAASIHWHGQHMVQTPHMDGIPFVTQCPIDFSTTFRYKFWAAQSGTQFYHSHSGASKTSGQYSGLVVREAKDSNQYLYDYDLPEHFIIMGDWMHSYPEMFLPGLPTRPSGVRPDSLLINDRGQFFDPITQTISGPPPKRFYVKAGLRYRFRYVNAGNHACPIQLQVEKHNLTVIATDSHNVHPKNVTTIVNNAGERYDFVIAANQPPGDYFIRIRGLGNCASHKIETFAILSYSETIKKLKYPTYDETFSQGITLNEPNAECLTDITKPCITELQSITTDEELRDAVPDQQLYLGFAMKPVNESYLFNEKNGYNHFANFNNRFHVMGAINDISNIFPPFPPLTQPNQLNEINSCDKNNIPKNCEGLAVCPCIHIVRVKLNSIVEILIVDESSTSGVLHPFHMHGVSFMVTDMGHNPLNIPLTAKLAERLDKIQRIPRILNPNPPLKDTVSVPSKGYSIIRFRADNPGFWMMHCHYEWHILTGMGLIVQIGEPEDMVKPPKDFPKCGNYLPSVL